MPVSRRTRIPPVFNVQLIPNFSLKCSECGAQFMRNQFGGYDHLDPKLFGGGKCEHAATKINVVVDDKGFVKLEKV